LKKFSLDQAIAKAKLHVGRGDLEQARGLYNAVLKAFPNNLKAREGLSTLEARAANQLRHKPSEDVIKSLLSLYNARDLDRVIETASALVKTYPNSSDIWNIMGAAAGQTGCHDQAILAFRKVIQLQPDSAGAYNNLGTALKGQGKFEEAVTSYRQAINISPDYVDAYSNLGLTLVQQGKLDAAFTIYSEALSLRPEFAEVHNYLGIVLDKMGKSDQAIASYKKAISLNPDLIDAHFHLGCTLLHLGNLDDAVAAFCNTISLNQNYAEAHSNLGVVFEKQGKLDEAIMSYNSAIAEKPDYAEAYYNLGIALKGKGQLEAAISAYSKAISIKPDYAQAYNNLGTVLQEQNKIKEALSYHKEALIIKPDFGEAYYNLGVAYKDLGRLDEAIAAYQTALSVEPDHARAHKNLGHIYWSRLEFARAFELLEWRWLGERDFIGQRYESSKPTWDGSEGKEVFAWSEQGIGDEIMFSSMIAELNNKSNKLTVECDPRLVPLYERSFPANVSFVNSRKKIRCDDYDSQIAIGSLLKHFRHELSDFAHVSAGWLRADPDRTAVLKEKLRALGTDRIIGLSWRTKASRAEAQSRNIPLEILAKFLKQVPGTYVNLQYGDVTQDLLDVNTANEMNILSIDGVDTFYDIDGLAALISACDLVISIDNSTVHLAGALGVDTRVLLPASADERWGLEGSESYWYDHLKLYRQETKGDWGTPMDRLIKDISTQ